MSGAVSGGLRAVLRVEGFCVLACSLFAYSRYGGDWGTFALLFLVPDLSFIGYVAGPRAGAATYNLAHSYIGALATLAAGAFLSAPAAIAVGLIWAAHIGFDRALGYGLKYPAGFGYTHLGTIGRARPQETAAQ